MSISLNDAWVDATGFTLAEQKTISEKANLPCIISLQCAEDSTTTCTLADTWYDIDGNFSDGSANGFTYVAAGGIMTKTCTRDSYLTFTGDSDLSIGSNAATITYGLFVDLDGEGFVEDTRFRSEVDFTVNEGTKSVGTNGITSMTVPVGAKGKVMVKSSVAGIVVTHHNLKVTSTEV